MASGMDLYTGLAQFSSDMYGQVVMAQTMDQQNVLMSPLSVYVALLMTLAGTGGQTRLELQQSMRLPPELEGAPLHDMFGSALRKISSESKYVTASLANRLFVLQNMNIRDEFEDILNKSYSAETEVLVDYADMEAKRQRINQWVSEQTNSKIPELLSAGALQEKSIMTIVNTVYFKGKHHHCSHMFMFFKGLWKLQFDKQMTSNGLFHRIDGSAVEVPMMKARNYFPYQDLPELQAVAVKLPFRDTA
ncbi:hypothetical protein T265_05072 [Opisthorchis viverrini]|uniref:Serpin domain-containing protein n=1 Tax=Opisthorchis viverrini TaxID=6198 RepID=A0A074ZQC8_OPIVI|nr:hypothetical protein T265_05072 [Opisthorchis viverrini]KER28027.1 hypothetical protein T265_05072 [Opisthorchis viverrini]